MALEARRLGYCYLLALSGETLVRAYGYQNLVAGVLHQNGYDTDFIVPNFRCRCQCGERSVH